MRGASLTIISLILGTGVTTEAAAALNIASYYSPRNSERPPRASTDFIILHTTEGPARGSLRKLHERGEAHYFVNTNGKVLRIIDRRRVAFHAGRSMWDGRTDLDNCSIGIELVGYHDRDITAAQYAALKELLRQLQGIYQIPDERVITHSMIAYGAPNAWYKRSHRGRKRCGMLFARDSVRRKIGLDKKPSFDPDVRAGRLVNADPQLARILYSRDAVAAVPAAGPTPGNAVVLTAGKTAWDVARDRYNTSEVTYRLPDGKEVRGDLVKDWNNIPAGTVVVLGEASTENPIDTIRVIGRDGKNAREIAGEEFDQATIIYFLPDGRIRRGDELAAAEIEALPEDTRVLVGYVDGGYISKGRSAFDICGPRWNRPDTYYRLADKSLVAGSGISETSIPRDTRVFFRN